MTDSVEGNPWKLAEWSERRVLLACVALLMFAYALSSTTIIAGAGWIQDDTFIFLTYARNLSAGNGLVFNTGERVCGVTSPLWTAMLSLLFFVVHEPSRLAAVLSAFTGGAALIALLWMYAPRFRLAGGLASIAALLVAPSFRVWSASGMETSLFLLLIVLSLVLLRARRFPAAGLAVGLAMLVRPEGYLLALSCLAAALVRRESRRDILRGIGAGLAVVVPWLIFSQFYYGSAIPQSLLAKRIVYSEVLFHTPPSETLRLFLAYGFPSLTMTAVSLFGFGAERRLGRDIDIIGFGVLYLVFHALGRSFTHDWYLAPVTLVKAYGIGLALGWFHARVSAWLRATGTTASPMRRPALANAAVVVAVVLVCGALVPMARRTERGLSAKQSYIDSTLVKVAEFSRSWPRGGSIFVNAIGYVGYSGARHVIDSLGLISPEVLPSFRRRAWVEPIMDLGPEIVVLGPTAGTDEILADPWFSASYTHAASFGSERLSERGGTSARTYEVYVKARKGKQPQASGSPERAP
jgi:hypothetical protein